MAPTNLYLATGLVLQQKRRAFRIEIDNPLQGASVVAYHQEDVMEDSAANILSRQQAPSLSYPAEVIEMTVYPITDPLSGQNLQLSGAAVAEWLAADYMARATALYAIVTTTPEANLATAEVAPLSTDQVQPLGTTDVAALSTDDVAALTTDQVAALTTTQI